MGKVRTFILLALVCVSLAFAGCCGCDFNPCDWNPCDPCGTSDDGAKGGGDAGAKGGGDGGSCGGDGKSCG